MTQEELNAAIEADGYCKPREEIKEFDNRLYLQEVGARCPLCGKLLIDRRQKKKVMPVFSKEIASASCNSFQRSHSASEME